jgi:cyanophycin synthetase
VVLKRVINDNCEREDVNGRLCSAILESACRAAQIVGTRLAGLDIICRDPGVPLELSGGAIIEVNATPGLYYHHRTDSSTPIANRVLQRVFDLATD